MLRIQPPLPERYTEADPAELARRIQEAKATLGSKVFILGHHYQRDEVMAWADARGDSFRLSVLAQEHPEADHIVFCGVHFMAESADILTADHQTVILPDLNAGCSMADMADIDQVEEAWESLEDVIDIERLVPITYMNSSAALKAFVGDHGGAVCTSTNARAVLEWAFTRGDQVGSTDYIIGAVDEAPPGSTIAVGTEIHLVQRLDAETPDKRVVSLDPLICPCSTMFRIDAAHLAWVLESLVDGEVVNPITVDPHTATSAKVALDRMLAIT